ncbi:MAG: ATP-binding cassette domain-containing protein [Caldimonas sp.]
MQLTSQLSGIMGLNGAGKTTCFSADRTPRARPRHGAVALAAEPRLLFLDEPTAGLGAEGTARLAELVGELKRRLTIVVIEHDMRFLFGLADTVSVIYYGDTQVLFDVSLEVGRGEVVALLGPNGAGKTTLLRSVLGLTPVRRGRVRFADRDVTRMPTHEIARLGLDWVPDDRRIFPTLTVARNLSIARKKTAFRAWTEQECFGIFSALEYLMHRECENLSGGEMQMVAISRALLGAPGLVLFDEPSQGLAPKVVQDVMKTIERLRFEGIGVLVGEQNVQSALAVADRVHALDRGRVVHRGPGSRPARRRGAAIDAARRVTRRTGTRR